MKKSQLAVIVFAFLFFTACQQESNSTNENAADSEETESVIVNKDLKEEIKEPDFEGTESSSKKPDNLFVLYPDKIVSSGFLKGSNEDYRPEYMTDHDPQSWWTPNPHRDGKEAWIEIQFNQEQSIKGFEIWAGSHNKNYPKFGDIYPLNNRVKTGWLEFSDGSTFSFKLKDVDNWQYVLFEQPIKSSKIRLRVNSVYKGEKWNDLCIAEFLALTDDENNAYYGGGDMAKPVIYLYPEKTQKVNVALDFQKCDCKLDVTYPKYDKSWNVIAKPNGELTNLVDNTTHSYLFWDAKSNETWDLSKGFVVKGENTAEFLQEKLAVMGLLPKEYNEFIVYWLPLMQKNKYNLISFVNEEYSEKVGLSITPKPESVLRVFMVFKALDKPVSVMEQQLKPFQRNGFTVVEWGGTELKKVVKKDAI